MKNKLLELLDRPLIREDQQQFLLTMRYKKNGWRAASINILRFFGSVILAFVLFFILLFAGHYSGFESVIHLILEIGIE